MKIIADMHCHTIASTHAYSTVTENINVAKRKGLFAIAITDHGPLMPGAPGEWYFSNLVSIPRFVNGVYVVRGIEADIIDNLGNLDLDFKYEHSFLDWIIASIHTQAFNKNTDEDYRTEAYLNIAKNSKVNAIGHSGTPEFSYDYDRVIPEFGHYGKIVEINNHSPLQRKGSLENCIKIAKLCKKHNVNVILSSDAHYCEQVGEFDLVIKMLEEINFPEELIINANLNRFKKYLIDNTNVLT